MILEVGEVELVVVDVFTVVVVVEVLVVVVVDSVVDVFV